MGTNNWEPVLSYIYVYCSRLRHMHAFLYSTLCENSAISYRIEYQYFSLYFIKVRPILWQDYAEVYLSNALAAVALWCSGLHFRQTSKRPSLMLGGDTNPLEVALRSAFSVFGVTPCE